MTAPDAHLKHAREITRANGLVDLHLDSIIQQRLFRYDVRKEHRAGVKGQPLFWHADLPRMGQAGYLGAAMGIHYFPKENAAAVREANRQIDYLDWVAETDPRAMRIRDAADWETAANEGLIGMIPGVEGCHMLNGDIANLEAFCDRGIAYLTLTHFSKNSAATPSLGRGANEEDTLTPFGHEVVDLLNARGVVVDVAHANQRCAIEAARRSTAPVMATHSGAQGVHAHPRLLSDEAIDAVADGGGVIGIIFSPGFLTGSKKASSSCVVDHIDYIANRVGIDHVAIGSDYDGWVPAIPCDHRDCRDAVRVAAEMLRRGYDDTAVAKVWQRNALRVFRTARR